MKQQSLRQTTEFAEPARALSRVHRSQPVYQIGFWSSLAAGLFAATWPVTMIIQNVVQPPGVWSGILDYVHNYNPIEMLNLVPSLPLASAFLIMMAAIYHRTVEEKKIWSLLGLVFTIVYAVFASMNYLVQFIVVRPALLSGQVEGIAPFVMGNPNSVFVALANSYTFMSIALLFSAWSFGESKLEKWIRALFLAAGIIAPLELASTLINFSLWVGLPIIMVWCLAVPTASFLLAAYFRRESFES